MPELCLSLFHHLNLFEQHPRFIGSCGATFVVLEDEVVVLPAVEAAARRRRDGGAAAEEFRISRNQTQGVEIL